MLLSCLNFSNRTESPYAPQHCSFLTDVLTFIFFSKDRRPHFYDKTEHGYVHIPSSAWAVVDAGDVAMPSNVFLTLGMQHPRATGEAAREINVLPHRRAFELKPFSAQLQQTNTTACSEH